MDLLPGTASVPESSVVGSGLAGPETRSGVDSTDSLPESKREGRRLDRERDDEVEEVTRALVHGDESCEGTGPTSFSSASLTSSIVAVYFR